MSARGLKRALLALSLALASAAGCDTGGLVGGKCRNARIACDGECVDPQSDAHNCGTCGNVCDAGLVCANGACTLPGSSGGGGNGAGGNTSAQGGTEAGASNEGGAASGNAGAGASAGNGGTGGTLSQGGSAGAFTAGQAGEGGACSGPFNTPQQCGDCNTKCDLPTPFCSPDMAGNFTCVPNCTSPLVVCNAECVDLNTSSDNCGRCGNACPSGICSGGMCVGAGTGHVVAYCLNYAWPQAQPTAAHMVLLGNSIFLSGHANTRILGFTRYTPASERTQVDRDINWAARGRAYVTDTMTDATQLSARLTIQNYDVFLIYEQPDAPSGELATLGAAWAASGVLTSFTQAGGVVVVFDGAQGVGEMPALIDGAGLLALDGHAAISMEDQTTRFFNRAPGDAVGINVISPLSPIPNSCTFQISAAADPDTTNVITNAAAPDPGAAVVVHRVISR